MRAAKALRGWRRAAVAETPLTVPRVWALAEEVRPWRGEGSAPRLGPSRCCGLLWSYRSALTVLAAVPPARQLASSPALAAALTALAAFPLPTAVPAAGHPSAASLLTRGPLSRACPSISRPPGPSGAPRRVEPGRPGAKGSGAAGQAEEDVEEPDRHRAEHVPRAPREAYGALVDEMCG